MFKKGSRLGGAVRAFPWGLLALFAALCLSGCSSDSKRDGLVISDSCPQTCETSLFSPFDTNDKVMRVRLGAVRCIMLYDYFFRKDKNINPNDARAQAIKSRNYLRWERRSHCQTNMVRYLTASSFDAPYACEHICQGANSKSAA